MATTGVGAKWQVRALGMEWARTNKHRRFITHHRDNTDARLYQPRHPGGARLIPLPATTI